MSEIAQRLGHVERIDIHDRQQWLNLRKCDLTASDVGSLFGVGFRTPFAIWAEKTGRTGPVVETGPMKLGRWFEPSIYQALSEKYPTLEIRRTKIYLRSTARRFGATPDAVALMREDIVDGDMTLKWRPGLIVIQGKVVNRQIFNEQWRTDPENKFSPLKAPLGYQLQVLSEAMLIESAYGEPTAAALAPLVYDRGWVDIHLVLIPRRSLVELGILDRVDAFWKTLDEGGQPEMIPGEDGETLDAMYPEDNDEEINLSGDNELPGLFDERQRLGKEETVAKARRDAIKDIFKERMKEFAYARLADGRRVSLKTTRKDSYIVKAQEFRTLRLAKG